jgi:hypothetical protein
VHIRQALAPKSITEMTFGAPRQTLISKLFLDGMRQ